MKQRQHKHNAGFTLLELLIAMAISGMVMTGIYQAYVQQMRVSNTQNQVVDMQQSARVAMLFLERDIRLAGLNPSGMADVGIDTALDYSIQLSLDVTGGSTDGQDNDHDLATDEIPECDGNADPPVIYALSNDLNPQDGINDALLGTNNNPCHLMRNGQRLASNIDALNFRYFGVNEDAVPACGESCRLAAPATPQERANIRAVQITIIARAGTNIPGLSVPYTDGNLYSSQPPAADIVLPVQNDGFRRIRLTSEVRSRNIGLE
jgi:type IV pilus assembly protein PilW